MASYVWTFQVSEPPSKIILYSLQSLEMHLLSTCTTHLFVYLRYVSANYPQWITLPASPAPACLIPDTPHHVEILSSRVEGVQHWLTSWFENVMFWIVDIQTIILDGPKLSLIKKGNILDNPVAVKIFFGTNDSALKDENPKQHTPLEEYMANLKIVVQYLKPPYLWKQDPSYHAAPLSVRQLRKRNASSRFQVK